MTFESFYIHAWAPLDRIFFQFVQDDNEFFDDIVRDFLQILLDPGILSMVQSAKIIRRLQLDNISRIAARRDRLCLIYKDGV